MKTQTRLALSFVAGLFALSNSAVGAVNGAKTTRSPSTDAPSSSAQNLNTPSRPTELPVDTSQTQNTNLNSGSPQSGAIVTTDVAQKIREDLSARKDLSPQAQNIAIINDNGTIYLRGIVESEDEKRMIEDIARKSAMNATVTNELTTEASPQLDTTTPDTGAPLDVD